jgi:hypothetical protein
MRVTSSSTASAAAEATRRGNVWSLVRCTFSHATSSGSGARRTRKAVVPRYRSSLDCTRPPTTAALRTLSVTRASSSPETTWSYIDREGSNPARGSRYHDQSLAGTAKLIERCSDDVEGQAAEEAPRHHEDKRRHATSVSAALHIPECCFPLTHLQAAAQRGG